MTENKKLYKIETEETTPENFFAGEYPVAPEVEDVKNGAMVRKRTPVIKTAEGVSEASADKLADLYGIAADDSTDAGLVCYLTGEFFADALTLPDGVTIEALKPAFRKLGIFLK